MSEYTRLRELKKIIRKHCYHYYIENAPIISDLEFDTFMTELYRIEAIHPEWITENSPTQLVSGGVFLFFENKK